MIMGKGITVGYLPQEPQLDPTKDVWGASLRPTRLIDLPALSLCIRTHESVRLRPSQPVACARAARAERDQSGRTAAAPTATSYLRFASLARCACARSHLQSDVRLLRQGMHRTNAPCRKAVGRRRGR